MLKQQPEISLKLFLDCHDKAHSSMNNAWISAAGVIRCAFSYCNTLTGLVRLASSLRVVTGHALRGWPKGRGMELFWWNSTTIGWEAGQKLCVNTPRIYRQPLGMRLLFCVRVSRQDNFVASHILPPHPYYVSMNRSRTREGERGDGVECVHLNTLTKPTCVTGAFCLLVTFRDINTGWFMRDCSETWTHREPVSLDRGQ